MKAAWRALCVAFIVVAAASPSEPPDYRMDDYGSPTPATLRGAMVVSTDQAHDLWENHQAVFIDVLPQPPRPAGLPASTIWRPRPRFDIPDSIWLPDTGYGALAPVMETYLKDGLQRASAGNLDRLMVFYCKADCWMSWNAAKRAMTFGYTHVAWYPEGVDDWVAHGLPTERRDPVTRPAMAE